MQDKTARPMALSKPALIACGADIGGLKARRGAVGVPSSRERPGNEVEEICDAARNGCMPLRGYVTAPRGSALAT